MTEDISTPYGTAHLYRKEGGAEGHIMAVPGYSESLSHNKELVDMLANRGYDAFTFRQPRRKAATGDAVLNRNKDIILDVLTAAVNRKEKVHCVAHSFGSAALLRAALEAPERFAGLILMQPSGITGEQSFLKLIGRTGKKIAKNNIRTIRDRHLYKLKGEDPANRPRSSTTRKLIRSQLSSGYLIAKNPRLALNEAFTAIRHSTVGDIAAVQALGLPVHVVVAHDDELFRMSGNGSEFERIAGFKGTYHSIPDKNAPHDTFWLHPERTAETIDALIQHTLKVH